MIPSENLLEDKLHFGASKYIFKIAKELRQNMTPSEKKLWKVLRNRKFLNLKFRRQHPISEYIVDFYCPEKKQIIELDGGIHNIPEEKENDEIRENELEKFGLKMVRFKNNEVLEHLDKVLTKLERILT